MKNYLFFVLLIFINCTPFKAKKIKNHVVEHRPCQQTIIGKWVSISDSNSFITVTDSNWKYGYVGSSEDEKHTYFFLNNGCDTLCVVFKDDTSVYHIESIDSNYLDLTSLGQGFNQINWSINITSYRKSDK